MYGNVAEWVQECGMPEYSQASIIGSDPTLGASCESHGYRGGSWDSTAEEAASSYRNASSRSSDDRGIRVLREFCSCWAASDEKLGDAWLKQPQPSLTSFCCNISAAK